MLLRTLLVFLLLQLMAITSGQAHPCSQQEKNMVAFMTHRDPANFDDCEISDAPTSAAIPGNSPEAEAYRQGIIPGPTPTITMPTPTPTDKLEQGRDCGDCDRSPPKEGAENSSAPLTDAPTREDMKENQDQSSPTEGDAEGGD